MITITDFNEETLTTHTPLTRNQAIIILTLINKTDIDTLNKILAEAVAFRPSDTYFYRLKQALILKEI